MRYTETTTMRCYQAMPIDEFLTQNELIRQQAGVEKPLDWLAGQFLPDAVLDEPYDGWIVLQVCSILQTTLLRDVMSGPSHISRKVSCLEITPEDKAWLFSALEHHPEVVRVWRSMLAEAIAA